MIDKGALTILIDAISSENTRTILTALVEAVEALQDDTAMLEDNLSSLEHRVDTLEVESEDDSE